MLQTALFALVVSAAAPVEVSAATLDSPARARVVDALLTRLEQGYVFPDVAQKVAAAVRAKEAQGAYDAIDDPEVFARRLNDDVQAIAQDGHLRVFYSREVLPPNGETREPSAAEIARVREQLRRENFGFEKVERPARQHRLRRAALLRVGRRGRRPHRGRDGLPRRHRRARDRPAPQRRRARPVVDRAPVRLPAAGADPAQRAALARGRHDAGRAVVDAGVGARPALPRQAGLPADEPPHLLRCRGVRLRPAGPEAGDDRRPDDRRRREPGRRRAARRPLRRVPPDRSSRQPGDEDELGGRRGRGPRSRRAR